MNLEKRNCPKCNKETYLFVDDKDCHNCRTEQKIKKLGREAKELGYTRAEDYIVCPYCGNHYGEEEMHNSMVVRCCHCSKKFNVEVEYSVSYSTSKMVGKE